MKKSFLILLFLMLNLMALSKINTVFVIPFSHLDIGFTHTQKEVSNLYVNMFNDLLNIMDKFPDFAFTVETAWQFEQWINSNPDNDEISKIISYYKNGRLGFGAAFANMHTGFMNRLSLDETFKYPQKMYSKYSIEPKVCLMDDVPGFTADLPDILIQNGIRYFIAGVNDKYSSSLKIPGKVNLFYWEGPKGNKVLTWISKNSYMEGILLGSSSALEEYISELEEEGYPYDSIALLVASDNGGIGSGLMTFLKFKKGFFNEDLQVIFSTPSEFFEHIERKYEEEIPTFKGDWSGSWEIVKTVSPFSSSMVRWSQDVLEDMLKSNLIDKDDKSFENIIENILLYCEHSNPNGAGWPGKLTYDQIVESNEITLSYVLNSYDEIKNFLKKFEKGNNYTIWIRNNVSKNTLVKIPEKLNGKYEEAIIEINGKDIIATSFTEPSTNAYEPYKEGFQFYVNLQPGIYNVKIKERKPIEKKIIKSNVIENEYYKITLNDNGTFDVYDKESKEFIGKGFGKILTSFTSNENLRKEFSLRIIDSILVEEQWGKKLEIDFDDSFPIYKLRITLPNEKKEIILDYFLDKKKIPHVSYKNHSINYYIKFPSLINGNFFYNGPVSVVYNPNEFPAYRSKELSVNGYCGILNNEKSIVFGSRETFMVEYEKEESSLIFHLIRYHSMASTKDKGIVNIPDVEFGTPSNLRYSFIIISGQTFDYESIEAFLKPNICFK